MDFRLTLHTVSNEYKKTSVQTNVSYDIARSVFKALFLIFRRTLHTLVGEVYCLFSLGLSPIHDRTPRARTENV